MSSLMLITPAFAWPSKAPMSGLPELAGSVLRCGGARAAGSGAVASGIAAGGISVRGDRII